jgi:tRNA/rRNA methyltransferase
MIERNDVSIVLVEPQSPGNVGMVCRAMKNMGMSRLRLVNPCRTDQLEARKFAMSAQDLLAGAEIYTNLREALADSVYSVATTRRHGKYRQEIYAPEEIVTRIMEMPEGCKVALVFGREDSGLTTDEVALCRWQATIPTADEFGSLNLAQAVLIFCYELFRGRGNTIIRKEREPAPTEEIETLYDHMERSLLHIGFLNPQNPGHIMKTLRRIYARSELDSREVAVLRGMMAQIEWAANGFKGKKKL